MAMAVLSFVPATSISLSSPRRLPTRVIACSARAGKARASRKLMSDADLCNGLREFVSSLGFPEDHVPSTKELAENGRKDLANIVRRRGYKAVRELLSNSVCLTEGRILPCHFEDGATGQHSYPTGQHGATGHLLLKKGEKKKVKDVIQEALDMNHMMQGVSSFVKGPKTDFGSDLHVPNVSSIEEKVEKFLKYGSLDQDRFEDDIGHNLWLNAAEAKREYKENSTVSNSAIHDQRDPSVTGDNKETSVLNGTAVMSDPVPRTNNPEKSEMENQDEVERLKNLLQQKELELCQLRELFEKEKQALSTLQSEAEKEIKSAQKLIYEMELELLAAEESLAGLKEVEIEYMEEAQTVDIAGSFNGWHQPIKMDPHPDTESRNPRLWYTSLWLYPGEYEVKFIVDGEWKVDPKREISSSNGMQNNILRVDV